ncbi:MAG: hypothetical protein GDA56_29820 [Hormoscilla sp. GM7CHS1pb]|nr:hypothetical protein [Hormoscilla sp. GM7CHS1pb]
MAIGAIDCPIAPTPLPDRPPLRPPPRSHGTPDRPFWALTPCKTPVDVRHQKIVG